MIDSVIYAKKMILPTAQANVLQSLNMAAALGAAGVPVCFYPGVSLRKAARREPGTSYDGSARERRCALFRELTRHFGIADFAPGLRVMDGEHKGAYSARFSYAVARALLGGTRPLLYARDIGEGMLIARLLRLPFFRKQRPVFMYEMHEALFRQHRDIEGRPGWRRTLRREREVLSVADALVVTNQAIADIAVAELGFTGPVLVEPNGINEAAFGPVELFTQAAPWPGKDEAVSLLFLGNMHPGKGVPELVKAVGLLPEHFSLKVIGRGSDEAVRQIQALAAAMPRGRERIRLLGHVPQGLLREHCRGVHISVVPQQEGGGYYSPLKINESLALGLPVVCTPLEILAGYRRNVFSSRDATPEGLAAAIADLAERPEEARRLRENGLEAAATRTWKARAGRILAFARNLEARP